MQIFLFVSRKAELLGWTDGWLFLIFFRYFKTAQSGGVSWKFFLWKDGKLFFQRPGSTKSNREKEREKNYIKQNLLLLDTWKIECAWETIMRACRLKGKKAEQSGKVVEKKVCKSVLPPPCRGKRFIFDSRTTDNGTGTLELCAQRGRSAKVCVTPSWSIYYYLLPSSDVCGEKSWEKGEGEVKPQKFSKKILLREKIFLKFFLLHGRRINTEIV